MTQRSTSSTKKSMTIRDVSRDSKMRFDVINAKEQHKTQADTLKFLLDYYEKDDRNGTNN